MDLDKNNPDHLAGSQPWYNATGNYHPGLPNEFEFEPGIMLYVYYIYCGHNPFNID
jgi:hypothetical protein